MAQSSLYSSFYLTAKSGEQLPSAREREAQGVNTEGVGEYISTVEQTAVATKDVNSAIQNNGYAGLLLNGNNSLNNYNAYVRNCRLHNVA